MERELYDRLLNSIPEKFRKSIKDEIEFNHLDIEPVTNDIFLTACKWVLDNKKLHLRRVASHVSMDYMDEQKEDISELEEFINNFNEIAI